MKIEDRRTKRYPLFSLGSGIFRISDFGAVNCYLIEGSEKAMLIDTGCGFADLRGAIEELSDLPLIVVATHGHPDHVGGMAQFPEIYLNRADRCLFFRFLNSRQMRRQFFERLPPADTAGLAVGDIQARGLATRFLDIDASTSFDLGGKHISVVETPGHTLGSIAIIDDTDRVMFTGDAANPDLWMQLPHSTTVRGWLPTGRMLARLAGKYTCYYGHSNGIQSREQIVQTVHIAEELLAASTRNELWGRTRCFPAEDAEIHITYRTSRIF